MDLRRRWFRDHGGWTEENAGSEITEDGLGKTLVQRSRRRDWRKRWFRDHGGWIGEDAGSEITEDGFEKVLVQLVTHN